MALGVTAAAVPAIAVPGVVLTLLGGLSFPDAGRRARTAGRVAIAAAALGCSVGLARFALSKAMLGIVEGGQSAAAKSALYKLREVVVAQDSLRRAANWDPDGDHIGSGALLGGLAGTAPLRPGVRLETPLLNYAFHDSVETRIGPAMRVEGYLLVLCLPTPGGGWTARPDEPVDDERAERRYVAYAWPSEVALGMATAFFTDEHERLRVLDLPRGAPAPYFGAARPPACGAALGADGQPWTAWKNKQPRQTLPGDR